MAVVPASAKHSKSDANDKDARWVCTWTSSPQFGDARNEPPAPGITDSTLRQNVHFSIGGQQIRIRFFNAFGTTVLTISSAHVALAKGGSASKQGSDMRL